MNAKLNKGFQNPTPSPKIILTPFEHISAVYVAHHSCGPNLKNRKLSKNLQQDIFILNHLEYQILQTYFHISTHLSQIKQLI